MPVKAAWRDASHHQSRPEALFTGGFAHAHTDDLQKLLSPSTLDLSTSKGGCQRYDSEVISRFSASWMVPGGRTTICCYSKKPILWPVHWPHLYPKHALLRTLSNSSHDVSHQTLSPKKLLTVVRMWLLSVVLHDLVGALQIPFPPIASAFML